jgi:hypothetical protein
MQFYRKEDLSMTAAIRSRFLVAFAVVCVALMPTLSAASITPADFVGGVINQLEDNDFQAGFLGGDTTLDVGDIVFGNVRIQELTVPPFFGPVVADDTAPTTFTAIFALQVTAKSGPADPDQPAQAGSTYSWSFGPVSDAAWLAIFGPTVANPTSTGVRVDSDTMIKVYQDFNPPDYTDSSEPQSGSNGTPLYEFGFRPGGTLADGFWTVGAPTDVPLSLTLGSGLFDMGLHQLAGTDIFESHDFLDYSSAFGSSVEYDIEGFGSFGNPPGPDPFLPIASDGDFFVLPVPEPATLAIWSIIAGISMAGCCYRRRVGR